MALLKPFCRSIANMQALRLRSSCGIVPLQNQSNDPYSLLTGDATWLEPSADPAQKLS